MMFLVTSLYGEVNHSNKVDEIIAQDLKYKKLSMPKKSSDDVFVRELSSILLEEYQHMKRVFSLKNITIEKN